MNKLYNTIKSRLVLMVICGTLFLGNTLNAKDSSSELLEFLPAETNWFLLVENVDKLQEELAKTQLRHIIPPKLDAEFFAEVIENNKENMTLGTFELPFMEMLKYVDGDLIIFQTHYGNLKDFDFEHMDIGMIFQHDGKQIDQLEELVDEQFADVPEDAEKERNKIGEIKYTRYKYAVEFEVPVDWQTNPDYDENDPNSSPYIEITETSEAHWDYQHAITDDLFILTEGSNIPMESILNTKFKGADNLLDRDSFKILQRSIESEDESTARISFYYNVDDKLQYTKELRVETQAEASGNEKYMMEPFGGGLIQLAVTKKALQLDGIAAYDPTNPGAFRLLNHMKTADPELIELIDNSIDSFAILAFDVGAMLEELINWIGSESPEFNQGLAGGTAYVQAMSGIDPLRDLLYELDVQHLIQIDDINSFDKQGQLYGLELKNPAKVAQSLQTLFDTVSVSLPQFKSAFTKTETNGIDSYQFLTGELMPSPDQQAEAPEFHFSVAGEYLLLGNSAAMLAQGVQHTLEQEGRGEPYEHKRLKRFLKNAPDEASWLTFTKAIQEKLNDQIELVETLADMAAQTSMIDYQTRSKIQNKLREEYPESERNDSKGNVVEAHGYGWLTHDDGDGKLKLHFYLANPKK